MKLHTRMLVLLISSLSVAILLSSCNAANQKSTERNTEAASSETNQSAANGEEDVFSQFCVTMNIENGAFEAGEQYGGNAGSRFYPAFLQGVLVQKSQNEQESQKLAELYLSDEVIRSEDYCVLEWKRQLDSYWNKAVFYRSSSRKWQCVNVQYEQDGKNKAENYFGTLSEQDRNAALDWFCKNHLHIQDLSAYATGEKLGFSVNSRIYRQAEKMVTVEFADDSASLYQQAKERLGDTVVKPGQVICIATYENDQKPGMLHLLYRENGNWNYYSGGY